MSLKDIIVATQADLRANADHAIATFAADSRQVEGLRSETKIRQFSVTVDEPPTLGGTDTGPIDTTWLTISTPYACRR